MELSEWTWEKLVAADRCAVLLDKYNEGVRFLIMRGPCSLNAYVGVPSGHPLAGHDYNNLPVNCHGGLTFAGEGDDKIRPAGFFWYGWDYGHCDDRSFYDDDVRIGGGRPDHTGKRWTPDEVEKDAWEALYDFRRLIQLAEAIANKKQG